MFSTSPHPPPSLLLCPCSLSSPPLTPRLPLLIISLHLSSLFFCRIAPQSVHLAPFLLLPLFILLPPPLNLSPLTLLFHLFISPSFPPYIYTSCSSYFLVVWMSYSSISGTFLLCVCLWEQKAPRRAVKEEFKLTKALCFSFNLSPMCLV